MTTPAYNNNENDPIWLKIVIVFTIVILLLGFATVNCSAQTVMIRQKAVYDTVYCNTENIKKFVEIPNERTGRVKIYAVYKDVQNNINELIPVSQTVYEYISVCKSNGVQPSLGIKLRNRQISSLIRFKPKLRIRR